MKAKTKIALHNWIKKIWVLLAYFCLALVSCVLCMLSLSCENPEEVKRMEQETLVRKVQKYNEKNFRNEQVYYATDTDITKFKENERINYLAIGDSVSQGFFMLPFVSSPGRLNPQNEIEGVSWPAFFADFINKTQPNKLRNFWNLAMSSSTVADWNYFLDYKNIKYRYKKAKAEWNIITNKEIAKNKFFNFENEIAENFDFESETPFKKLEEKVRRANLMSITLGGNTIIGFFYKVFEDIFETIGKYGFTNIPPNTMREIILKHKTKIPEIFANIKEGWRDLIKRIRVLNPGVAIFGVGYPLNQFAILEKMLDYIWKTGEDFFTPVLLNYRKVLQEIGAENNISVVDTFNNAWSDFANYEYIGSFLDFHPGVKGHKWIAQQVFLKLAMPTEKLEKYLEKANENFRTDWLATQDKNYANFDVGQFRKEVYLTQESEEKMWWLARSNFNNLTPSEKLFTPWMSKNPDVNDLVNSILEKTNLNYITKLIRRILNQKKTNTTEQPSQNWEGLLKNFMNYIRDRILDLSKRTFWIKEFNYLKELLENFVAKLKTALRGATNIVLTAIPILTKMISSPEGTKLLNTILEKIRSLPFLLLSEGGIVV